MWFLFSVCVCVFGGWSGGVVLGSFCLFVQGVFFYSELNTFSVCVCVCPLLILRVQKSAVPTITVCVGKGWFQFPAIAFVTYECDLQVEVSSPKELSWQVNLYRGYIAICHPDEPHLNMVSTIVYQSDPVSRSLTPIVTPVGPILTWSVSVSLSLTRQVSHPHPVSPQ